MALSLGRNALFLLTVFGNLMGPSVDATPIMRRPDTYKVSARVFATEDTPSVQTVGTFNTTLRTGNTLANGKTSFAYFTNWGIYGANFQPTDIVPGPITHILYSFADTNPSTGSIILTDSYADQEKRYPGDSVADSSGTNLYGCLKQLYLLKLRQRNLKVLLSIGGWTYSQSGHFNFVTSASARAQFVSDAIKLVEDYGFDGIDIDFEYPSNSAQGQGLADLVTALRTAFNQLASRKGDSVPYLITAAVGAGPTGYSNLKVPQMNSAMDFWNLMAYDYAGSWLAWSDHQANVYGGARTGFSTDAALRWYLNNGATAGKINLGMPLYGRAFQNTNGIGQPYSGIGPGTIEAGIYSYKALPLAGALVYEDRAEITSHSYDSGKRELVSYDTPNTVRAKVAYALSNGLSGSMFWELAQDKVGANSLVKTSADSLGGLDSTQNHINFPNSKWQNVRNNMRDSPPTSSTSTSTSTSSTATPTTTSNGPTPTGGSCAGVGAWSSTVAYWGGDRVIYGSRLWTAKWWTQNDVPGGAAGVWTDNGSC